MSETNEKAIVPAGQRGLKLGNLEAMWRFATAVAKSGLAPKGVSTPEAILVAIQFGAELGLPPMASLQSVAVINGRPSIWGDAALGIVRASGQLEVYREEYVGKDGTDEYACVVTCKRVGMDEASESFSVGDAKKAKLWGKPGPWSEYPTRMLKWRARGFLLRDQFGDLLRGLRMAEEMMDMPAIDVETRPSFDQPAPKPLFADTVKKQTNDETKGGAE